MIKLVILSSNADELKGFVEYFSTQKGFQVCAASDDGCVGVESIREYKPDVVILSLVLKSLDGIGVMDNVHKFSADTPFIALGSFTDEALVNRVMAKGAKYYLMKPVQPDVVAARIQDLLGDIKREEYADVHIRRRQATLDEKISNIFISIGIPPHIKGYNYLREGIKMAVEQPSVINNVTKVLYPKIGEKFDTSASKVERAIRHAIEVAWNRGRIDAINAIFGVRVYIGSEKPTNSEFIALVADKLILESMM